MRAKNILLILLFVSLIFRINAQLNIVDANTAPYNTTNLIRNVFLGSGVEITGINFEGSKNAAGYFEGGKDILGGLEKGIVLSTGFAANLDGENITLDENGDVTSGNSVTDADLELIAGADLEDMVKYTIKFIPTSDTLRFKYVFASEEFPNFVCESFNDVFGFFISGPDPSGGNYVGRNIALVPDPNDPSGLTFTTDVVSINNVHTARPGLCEESYLEYYNVNPIGTENFALNAYLDIFTAQAIVTPCEEYTIKLVIADAGDKIKNSAVFLEAKSFGTGSLTVSPNTLSVDGSIAEGCEAGELVFSLPNIVTEDYIVDLVLLNPPNAATPGIDYPTFPPQIIIPAGSRSVSLPIEGFLDNQVEGDEVIAFTIQLDLCNQGTYEIIIRDDGLLAPLLPNDVTICQGDNVDIISTLDPDFVLPLIPFFESSEVIPITPEGEPVYSDILVSGVFPTILTPDLIERVCIVGLEHILLDNLDIYLEGPDGQFLELTTDNGNKALNISDIDRYENTCFTVNATENINRGNNLAGPIDTGNETYTGDYLPEGSWSDLWDNKYKTNGTWRLLMIDDNDPGIVGTLEGWSITFKSFYDIQYEWTADVGAVSCTDCAEISVSPTEDTEYTLTFVDSYGCSRSSSTNVIVTPTIPKPNGNCDNTTQNSIDIGWNSIPGVISYEIRVDNGSWENVGLDLTKSFINFSSDRAFNFEIRALVADCISDIESITCSTLPCNAPSIIINSVGETSCPSGNDAVVDVNATGLFPPFTFLMGGETNLDGQFNMVPQGVNNLVVIDNEGCVITTDITVLGPDDFEFTPSFNFQDPCDVNGNISGTIAVTGGTGLITYDWGALGTQENLTNLSPGSYPLAVTDAQNCSAISNLDIPQLNSFSYTVDSNDASCFGGSNGKAEINVVDGNAPYDYLWDDGSTEATYENLTAGSYNVTVTDSLGCEISRSFDINEGTVISIDIDTNNPTCAGNNDGTAVATVSGGLAPYAYDWPSGTQDTNEDVALVDGQYELTIADANGCTLVQSFTISDPLGIDLVINKVDNGCFGDIQGEIEIIASSSNGALSIMWSDNSTEFMRKDLSAGKYYFLLDDGTSCSRADSVEILQPEMLSLMSTTIVGPQCINGANGEIVTETTGGTGPYTYEWSGPIPDLPPQSFIDGLEVGEYRVTISDAVNCELAVIFVVEAQSNVEVSPFVTDVLCSGERTGAIAVNPSGGNEPYSFSWVGPGGFTSNQQNIDDLASGSYNLTIEDNLGCTKISEILVAQPGLPLLANISVNDSTCFGFSDGRLSISPSGGTGPYEINWSNGEIKPQNINLSKGTYTVTITDIRGCSVVAEARIIERADVEVDLSQTPSLCFGTPDGSAEISEIRIQGEVENLSLFTYKWNTNPPDTTPFANNLIGGGTYSVVVKDRFGCQEIASIIVETPDSVEVEQVSLKDVSCFGGEDARIEVVGIGGVGNYNYQWGTTNNFAQGSVVDLLRKGIYAVSATDSNGCLSRRSFEIDEPTPLSMEFRNQDVNCYGEGSGSSEAIVFGGTKPYSYLWENGTAKKTNLGLLSQQYLVSITDANGCLLVDSTDIEEPESPIMIDVDVTDATCFNSADGKIQVEAIGGSGFYQYSLDDNFYTSTKKLSNLAADNYVVYVKDLRGCKDSFPDINLFEPNEIIVDLGQDKVIPFGSTTVLSSNIFNVLGNPQYRWVSANLDLISCTTCADPIFEGEREASFELIVIGDNGCRGSDFISVRLQNSSPLSVPTAFTPNVDGENDRLVVFGSGIKKVKQFKIYDRWGELVFESKDFDVNELEIGWDGIFKGNNAPPGLYYWFAEVEFINGFEESFEGNTTLLR